ncbi:G2/M phase-specific E3 ubiquitin-protein ligase [Fundulus heteroclitus]|uniref:G2/M phase-specific E3 ubiquitin-protein ligase n=1 Tax=Fundulus heteroclitus TaxID=8078 RepID=UPI00165ACCB8|nr:G2/M phase-specific E3 ubiquitin-protein ligase [Fundulus heteroclitus]XP_035996723.1 G2/M phase-specific E3 ubiquitin-protein ligase [Fundulus heteroclitus]
MKLCDKRSVLLAITENIEMRLFSSEEEHVVMTTQEKKEENTFEQRYRYLEHPLAPDPQEDEDPPVELQPRQQAVPRTKPPVCEDPLHCCPISDATDDTDIEMESFPPIRLSDIELVEIKSSDPPAASLPSPQKARHVKWKKLTPQKVRHVVKDVICLPREHYVAQLEGIQITPHQAALADMGLTARITVDSSWSADQMESRLALLFHRQFVRKPGQRFSFTYLQSVRSSKVLFVPETPAEGWTGEQVLRMSEHGALYIFSHHNYEQTRSESPLSEAAVLNWRDLGAESSKVGESPRVGQNQPHVCRAPEKLTLNLDTILRLFRLEVPNGDTETHIKVSRDEILSGALKEVRKPGFCFRSKPVISFSEDEMGSHEDPTKEFFRLTLLELQQSCVFEGRPERLFLTYDLTALDDRMYYEAGVLIGWSLAHGGPGPCFLHPALYQLMCCQSPSFEDFNWRDIVDPEAQRRLQELHSCSDVKQFSPGLCDWVSSCGIHGIHSACSNEIPAIYARLVKHYIYHRVASMISQFIEGLNSCGGLWDLVKTHWETFLPVMTSKEQRAVSLEEFKQLFTFCFSDPDSGLRAAEEATAAHWETVLTMVSDGEAYFSFEDLLLFITGVDHLPPLGFPNLISLRFYSQDTSSLDRNLPHAFQESLDLFLPRGIPEALDLLVLLNRALHRALEQRLFQQMEMESFLKL